MYVLFTAFHSKFLNQFHFKNLYSVMLAVRELISFSVLDTIVKKINNMTFNNKWFYDVCEGIDSRFSTLLKGQFKSTIIVIKYYVFNTLLSTVFNDKTSKIYQFEFKMSTGNIIALQTTGINVIYIVF